MSEFGHGQVIQIKKPYFGIDKNGEITYKREEITGHPDFFYVEYATLTQIKRMFAHGYCIMYYNNPNNKNGLWNKIVANSDVFGQSEINVPKLYDYRAVFLNIKNMVEFESVELSDLGKIVRQNGI